MKKVRYGILGFGRFAELIIAPAIRASTNSELVAVQKRSLTSAKEKAREHGIPLAFDSAEALVAHPDVDAVFIVSANAAHCADTLAATRAGKHVLVEKPMAVNVSEAERMIEACKNNSVKLMVGHMIRFSPLARRLKNLIQEGAIGSAISVNTEFIYDQRRSHRGWLLDRSVAGGGPVFDIGVHCLDTIRFILEKDILSIQSLLEPRPNATRTESRAHIAMQFSGGIIGSISCSFDAPIRRSSIEIIGTEGILQAPDFTRSDLTIPLTITRRHEDESGKKNVESIVVPNLYIEEITHFSECMLNDQEPMIPGDVGLENQKVLDEVMRQGGK